MYVSLVFMFRLQTLKNKNKIKINHY